VKTATAPFIEEIIQNPEAIGEIPEFYFVPKRLRKKRPRIKKIGSKEDF